MFPITCGYEFRWFYFPCLSRSALATTGDLIHHLNNHHGQFEDARHLKTWQNLRNGRMKKKGWQRVGMWNSVLTERPSSTQNHGCDAIEVARLSPKAREREQWNHKDLPRLDAHALPLSQQEGITQQERCKQSFVWNTLGTDRRTPSTECRRKCPPPLQLSCLKV